MKEVLYAAPRSHHIKHSACYSRRSHPSEGHPRSLSGPCIPLGVSTGSHTPAGSLVSLRPVSSNPKLCPSSDPRPCDWGYLSVTGDTEQESLVQVINGGGVPWASQSRVISSPALAVTLRGLSVSCDLFTWNLGPAVGGSIRDCEQSRETGMGPRGDQHGFL